jgi:hypothetical protein
VFGVLRAGTARIWSQDGQVWAKGNWLTGLLWIVALGVQRLVAQFRASRMGLAPLGSPRSVSSAEHGRSGG